MKGESTVAEKQEGRASIDELNQAIIREYESTRSIAQIAKKRTEMQS